MANESIFSGKFFYFEEIQNYAFQIMKNNFWGKISVVTITTEISITIENWYIALTIVSINMPEPYYKPS